MAQNRLEIVEKANPTIKELAIQAVLEAESADADMLSNKTLKEVVMLRDNTKLFSGQTLADVSGMLNMHENAQFRVEDTLVGSGEVPGGTGAVVPVNPDDPAPGSFI